MISYDLSVLLEIGDRIVFYIFWLMVDVSFWESCSYYRQLSKCKKKKKKKVEYASNYVIIPSLSQ